MSNDVINENLTELNKLVTILQNWFDKKEGQKIDMFQDIGGVRSEVFRKIESLADLIDDHKGNNLTPTILQGVKSFDINFRESINLYGTRIVNKNESDGAGLNESISNSFDRFNKKTWEINWEHPLPKFHKIIDLEHGIHNIFFNIVGFGGTYGFHLQNPNYVEYSDIKKGNWVLPGADSGTRKQGFLNVHDVEKMDVTLEFGVHRSGNYFYAYTVLSTYYDKERTILKDRVRVRSGRILVNSDHPIIERIGRIYHLEDFSTLNAMKQYDTDNPELNIIKYDSNPGQGGYWDTYSNYFPLPAYTDFLEQMTSDAGPPLGGNAGFGNGFSSYFRNYYVNVNNHHYMFNLDDIDVPQVINDLPLEIYKRRRKAYDDTYNFYKVDLFFYPAIGAYVFSQYSDLSYSGYPWFYYYQDPYTAYMEGDFGRGKPIKNGTNLDVRKMYKKLLSLSVGTEEKSYASNTLKKPSPSWLETLGSPVLFNRSNNLQPIGAGSGGVPQYSLIQNEGKKSKIDDLNPNGNSLVQIYTKR